MIVISFYSLDELAKQLDHSGAIYVITVPPFAPKTLEIKDKVPKLKVRLYFSYTSIFMTKQSS